MPRKVLDRDDLDTSHEYPFAVPEDNAEGATWVSPTKAVKEYHQPLKRKRRASGSPTPRSGTGKRAVVGETDNLAPEETYSHDVGPSDLWDLSLMDHEAQTDQVASEEGGADALANYLEAVETFGAGWYCINDSLFVVQGWDARRVNPTSNWYHLQHLEIEQEVVVACTCPRHTQDSTCVHSQFFNLYDVESLSAMTASSEAPGNEKAIIFYRQQLPNAPEFLTMFSVQGFSTSELKGRAIVSHTGVLPSAGTWKCSKHAEGTLCVHVQDAFHRFQTLVGDNGQELDPAIFCKAPALATIARTGAISHSAILPPISLALTNDPAIYPRPPPFRNPPESTLSLNHAGSCPCPTGRTFYSPLRPTDTRSCRIFTLFTVYEGTIEVQPCPTCPAARRRLVGPDLVELGLFNFNNSIIVSHELLDEYTMAFVTSETPFNAFVATLNHRYAVSGAEFIGDDLFHSIWFAYATCLAMDNDMQCTRCGRCPDTVIWDGITLAFGRKHLSATLVPPTQVSVQSLQRSNVKNHPRQQLLLDSSLRKLIRQAVNPPKLTESQPEDVLNEPASNAARIEQSRHSRLVVEHLARIDAVYDGLRKECEALARLFLDAYGAVAFAEKKPAPAATTRFFLQVAAEESVLQMVNATALSNLNEFLAAPDVNHLTKILAIPGLYRMLKEQSSIDRLIPIGRWLADRAAVVLRELSVEHIPLSTGITPAVARADWKVTGTFYSLPQIRHRPAYPRLKSDHKKDVSKPRGDRCGKYYTQYGERRLTGGIMVAWCTHSVCYGFHCIPESEGRNDVFSAMVTRWPVAPKRVIYDFACALGPYCMLREPEFFKHTLFAIDHFHSMGHTKCSPAAFLSEYANVDPRLVSINSSAGECGNSGLKRIRKSVSYMGQERAIIYTKVFLSAWNRLRLRKMG